MYLCNGNTRPSGHISWPTHIDCSFRCSLLSAISSLFPLAALSSLLSPLCSILVSFSSLPSTIYSLLSVPFSLSYLLCPPISVLSSLFSSLCFPLSGLSPPWSFLSALAAPSSLFYPLYAPLSLASSLPLHSLLSVARHGSGTTIHVQSPSRATHTASGIERHTSASVSKSAQAQSEPSGGQFSIQYQQVLSKETRPPGGILRQCFHRGFGWIKENPPPLQRVQWRQNHSFHYRFN